MPSAAQPQAVNKATLPGHYPLFREVWRKVLFGPKYRDLAIATLIVDAVSAATIIALVWIYFHTLLAERRKMKIFLFTAMSTIFLVTNISGTFATAALVLRMTGKSPNTRLGECMMLLRYGPGILALALVATFYRIIYVAANQLVCPFCGAVVLPAIVTRISKHRKGVGFQERLDMTLTVMLSENLSLAQSLPRVVEHYVTRWGDVPTPTVALDKVWVPYLMAAIFLVTLPLVIIGKVLKNDYLVAIGLTVAILVVTFLQYARPLYSNVYCCAAYRYAEHGLNDVWNNGDLAPQAFFSRKGSRASALDASEVKVNLAEKDVEKGYGGVNGRGTPGIDDPLLDEAKETEGQATAVRGSA